MSNKKTNPTPSTTKPSATKPKPTPAVPPKKKEEYPPLPPGQPGNPRQYTPVKVDGRKNPRKKEALAIREKRALKKGKPRQLPSLTLTRDAYKDVFHSAGDIEAAINKYRRICQESGDMPTLNGFCLSCGCNGSLLSGYIDGSNKDLAQAAQAASDWIVEQSDQAVIGGLWPVSHALHLGVNQHGRVNSRTYSEGHKVTDINTSGEFTHRVAAPEVTDMINLGPIKSVKQIKQADAKLVGQVEAPKGKQ